MKSFIGHFHPVLVHLPIGILLLACLFQWLAGTQKYAVLKPAIPVIFFWGMIGAIVSCVTGFLLSQTEDYDQQLVTTHQWWGIGVAILSIVMFGIQRIAPARWLVVLSIVIVILVGVTGHLGGSITHGPDYLTKAWNDEAVGNGQVIRKPIPDVQAAAAYADVVEPLLNAKCYGCHGPTRQKGKLRLDKPEYILRGGKDGKIMAATVDKSELMKRLLLPPEDDDHMPPKGKPQLNESDITLMHWWIENGAPFDKKVKDLAQNEKIKPVLLDLQRGAREKESATNLPTAPVEKADDAAIQKLKARGIVVLPVAQNSNYLLVNFSTADSINSGDLTLLLPVRRQVAWLKLSGTAVNDSVISVIGQCENLVRLQLDNTGITDASLVNLSKLKNLQSLNLAGTPVTAQGVLKLKGMPLLQHLYLYQTRVDKNAWNDLKRAFPKASIDSGGYQVVTLAFDTTEVKAAKK